MWPRSYLCEHRCATKMTERSTAWCASPSLRRQTLYPQQSLTTVVLGRIYTFNDGEQCLGRAISNRFMTGVLNSRLTSTKTHAVARKLPQLHFCLLKQLSSISTSLPCTPPPPPTTIRKAVNNNSKCSLTLPCDRTVISQ